MNGPQLKLRSVLFRDVSLRPNSSGEVGHALISVFNRQMTIAMRLLDAVHFRCRERARHAVYGSKALLLFNVFADFTNRFV
jgi:hypothetical protein